ncbi:MAG: PhoH family protein [Rhizobiales bacterium]|nr:PhoH family protein [Hyphomicrobiales bacterium]
MQGQSTLNGAALNKHLNTNTSGHKKSHNTYSETIEFDDNSLAAILYGQNNLHLAMIESRLDVELASRGNKLLVEGRKSNCKLAIKILQNLYVRGESGESISKADVDGAIRMQNPQNKDHKADSNSTFIVTRRKTLSPRTLAQETYMKALQQDELVFGTGPAGTGKTYLAVAQACAMLEAGNVQRIVLSRPAVEAGEKLGFLPGDLKEKVDPYLRPLYDALYDMMDATIVERLLEEGVIEIAPLAFMRGRTLSNSFIILDEAQNTTTMQMKMILTRIGEGSRMVITGDPSQIDLPRGMKSGLIDAMQILDGVDEIHQIRFKEGDVIRHPLVAKIVRAYNYSDGTTGNE